MHDMTLSNGTLQTIGIFFLAYVAVEFGGITVLRVVRGTDPRTDFQTSFARAGHAHAAVLLVLATLSVLLADVADVDGGLSGSSRALACGLRRSSSRSASSCRRPGANGANRTRATVASTRASSR